MQGCGILVVRRSQGLEDEIQRIVRLSGPFRIQMWDVKHQLVDREIFVILTDVRPLQISAVRDHHHRTPQKEVARIP